jgi:hypothetical protein
MFEQGEPNPGSKWRDCLLPGVVAGERRIVLALGKDPPERTHLL